MVSNGCVNGNLVEGSYSAPVPVIGLYIAAGSSACLLFMLIDIISAFRHRQRWIPCRLFSLNSITLTLLSICTKLPVDLTTAMPSLEDQLSKLTGTTVVCIAIGFFTPSLGSNTSSEYVSNMAALSILVITVVVNICIQISTGVIHQFVIEHITIMSCMLILLLLLWYSGWLIQADSGYISRNNRDYLVRKEGSMLNRLKICYLFGFTTNPQLKICRSVTNCTIAGFCLICSCVLLQATVRSVIFKQLQFCGGTSDYDWSMWIIVVSQILVVVVGCCATSFRFFTLFPQVEFDIKSFRFFTLFPQVEFDIKNVPDETVLDFVIRTHPLMRRSLQFKCLLILKNNVYYLLWLPTILIMMPATVLFKMISGGREDVDVEITKILTTDRGHNSEAVLELTELLDNGGWLPNMWTLRKVASNINMWVEVSKSEPPKYLQQLLARTRPSHKLHSTTELKDLLYPDQQGIEVSSFTMVLLVKLATFSVPENLAKSLEQSFEEAYEIIQFIETTITSASGNVDKTKLTKAVLLGDGFHVYLPKIIRRSSHSPEEFHSLSHLCRAGVILKELRYAIGWDMDRVTRVDRITKLINQRGGGGDYETIEELYYCMEQIFVDILHLILAQLPNVIYKLVADSPAEEFEERVRIALKLWCKAKWLEDHVRWAPAPTKYPQSGNDPEIVESIHDLDVRIQQVEQK